MSKTTTDPEKIQFARDKRLARRITRGEEAAIREIMDEYFPRLYRYTRHRLDNEADVDEVVQTVLAQAAHRMETYRGEATLLTWLIQICRHEISRSLKRVKHDRDFMVPFLNDELLRSVVESITADGAALSPDEEYTRFELINRVKFSLDQLPERFALALELKYIEGYSSKEIAHRMQISDEAVQSLLARARRAFRDVCGEALRLPL